MSIRSKLVLFSAGAVIIAVVSIGAITIWQFRDYARHSFERQAVLEIRRIDTVLSQYIATGKTNAELLAQEPLLRNGVGKFTSYAATTASTTLLYAQHNPYEQEIYRLFMSIKRMNPSLGLIFMGAVDGGFVQAPENDTLGPGYDPRKRPWYIEAMNNPEDINVSKVYRSTSGDLVTSVSARIRSPQGSLAGILALDLDLSMLSKYIADLRIGETGYAMVFDKDGTILMDPKDNAYSPQTFFKKIGSDVLPTLQPLTGMSEGFIQANVRGVDMDIAVYTSGALGWKIITLVPTEEVNRRADNTVLLVAVAGLVICAVFALLMALMARSITRPIQMVVSAAQAIAGGNFKALPDARFFSGEMLRLRNSLDSMVSELRQLVVTSEAKSREAEEQSKKAAQAVREAEEARRQAELARNEGSLAAAKRLESVVGIVSAAAKDLAAHIAQSERGSQSQAASMSQTATAMEEMNSTVLEVARNAGVAAEGSDNAKRKAAAGSSVVRHSIEALGRVQESSRVMDNEVRSLGEQAGAIGRIMTVISDIADQTNLLALNAAIEAARAGDAGRGFAVVADEVRKLAEKTMTATKEVGEAITGIQNGTQRSIASMQEATRSIEDATGLAQESGAALEEIVAESERVASQIQAIATAAEEQSATSEEINKSINYVSDATSRNAAYMREAAAAVAEMARQTQSLSNIVGEMKRG